MHTVRHSRPRPSRGSFRSRSISTVIPAQLGSYWTRSGQGHCAALARYAVASLFRRTNLVQNRPGPSDSLPSCSPSLPLSNSPITSRSISLSLTSPASSLSPFSFPLPHLIVIFSISAPLSSFEHVWPWFSSID
jgi:hypothetical protein